MPSIVHVAQFYHPHGGGIETHIRELNRQLIDRGYQVSVVTTQYDSSLKLKDQLEAVTIVRLPLGAPSQTSFLQKTHYKLTLWTEILRLWKVFFEADIIHVHDVYWWLLPLLPIIKHKTFIIFHGWEGTFPVSTLSKLQRWLWAALAVRTFHIGTYLQHFYWDKPDRIIFGAIDKRFITTPVLPRPAAGAESKKRGAERRKSPKKTHIVYIGRLVAENEIKKYIELAIILRKKGFEFELTWVGDGPFIKQCAKVGKTVGFVSDVLPYLDEADVVLATSYLSTMQAQARGKITCGLFSHPLKEATLTTFPTAHTMLIAREPSVMAELIQKLIDNPSLKKRYEQQAQAWARTQTWSHVADEYEKLWGTYG